MYRLPLFFLVGLTLVGSAGRMAFAQSESSAIEQLPNYGSVPVSEPMIAVNPTAQNNFITVYSNWIDNAPTRRAGSSFTTDGGLTWTSNQVPISDNNFLDRADPSVAFDANGSAYYCYLSLRWGTLQDSSAIRVSESTDQGANWSSTPLTVASHGGADAVLDKPWIACDQTSGQYKNSMYVSWTYITSPNTPNQSTYQTYFSYKRPGQAFSTPISVSALALPLQDVEGSYIVVGKDGAVYVFWAKEVALSSPDTIMMAKSTDGGQHFTVERDILPGTSITNDDGLILNSGGTSFQVAHSWPVVAVNPGDGSLNLVYGGGGDVFYSVSRDTGHTWSTPTTKALKGTFAQIWAPTIAFNSQGAMVIAYYAGGGDDAEVLTATSTDGGNSFTSHSQGAVYFTPKTVSPKSDYIGVAYNNNTYWAVWPQASGTNTNLYGRYRTVSAIVENTDSTHNDLSGTTVSVGTFGTQSSPYTTPYVPAGKAETLTAGSQQTISNKVYHFYRWEDVGLQLKIFNVATATWGNTIVNRR